MDSDPIRSQAANVSENFCACPPSKIQTQITWVQLCKRLDAGCQSSALMALLEWKSGKAASTHLMQGMGK